MLPSERNKEYADCRDFLLRRKNEPLTPPFVEAERFDLANYTNDSLLELVRRKLYDEGVPIVLENTLSAFALDKNIFSSDFLRDCHGSASVLPRDVLQGRVVERRWRCAELLDHLNTPRESRNTPVDVYGNDMTCPNEWKTQLQEKLPDFLTHEGSDDSQGHLPKILRSENLMLYVGTGGSWTPSHVDICASVGHNLMVQCDEGAGSLWFTTRTKDKNKFNEFLDAAVDRRVDFDNYFIRVETLDKSPVPIYVVEQGLGDFVLLPPSSAHQVANLGEGLTIKVSWNRLTAASLAACLETELPILNHICKKEIYQIKNAIRHAVVYTGHTIDQHISEDGYKRKVAVDDHLLLLKTYQKVLLAEYDFNEERHQPTVIVTDATEDGLSCDFCEANIFNRWFHCSECRGGHDLCIQCAALCRSCIHRNSVLYQLQSPDELVHEANISVDQYNKAIQQLSGYDLRPFPPFDLKSLAQDADAFGALTVALNVRGAPAECFRCHECNSILNRGYKSCTTCEIFYCSNCLANKYADDLRIVLPLKKWTCFRCRKSCHCSVCRRKAVFHPLPVGGFSLSFADEYYRRFDLNKANLASPMDDRRIKWIVNSRKRGRRRSNAEETRNKRIAPPQKANPNRNERVRPRLPDVIDLVDEQTNDGRPPTTQSRGLDELPISIMDMDGESDSDENEAPNDPVVSPTDNRPAAQSSSTSENSSGRPSSSTTPIATTDSLSSYKAGNPFTWKGDFARYLLQNKFIKTLEALCSEESIGQDQAELEMLSYYRQAVDFYGERHPVVKAFQSDAIFAQKP